MKRMVLHFTIIIFSIAFLFVANRIATSGLTLFTMAGDIETAQSIVLEVLSTDIAEIMLSDGTFIEDINITFTARITSGPHRNETITATQNLNTYFLSLPEVVEPGDRVLLMSSGWGWFFMDYFRLYTMMIASAAFLALLILFGKTKGVNAILGLCLTGTAIFAVLIPAVLAGGNIYTWSVVVCVYAITATLFIVGGVNKKSAAAALGCLGGLLVTGIFAALMDNILGLTGAISQEARHLLFWEQNINLRALIFAAVIIGATGAMMDVSMSIASALWEIQLKVPDASFRSVFTSGLNIGRDILGTMINTLMLAYISSSLAAILLISSNAFSVVELLNREFIIVEILLALSGGLGVFLTIPLTALICGGIFTWQSMYPDDYNKHTS